MRCGLLLNFERVPNDPTTEDEDEFEDEDDSPNTHYQHPIPLLPFARHYATLFVTFREPWRSPTGTKSQLTA